MSSSSQERGNGLLWRLFQAAKLTTDEAKEAFAFLVQTITNSVLSAICKAFGVENLNDMRKLLTPAVPEMTDEEQKEEAQKHVEKIISSALAGQQEIINEGIAKASALMKGKEVDARDLANQVGKLLLDDSSFMIALSEAQKKGKEASIDSKKKTIKEIVGEFRDITPESVSGELVEELFRMGVVRGGRSENWVTAIQTALLEKHARMSETITSLIRKTDLPKATEIIGKYAWFLVDSCVPAMIETVRPALEAADIEDQLIVPYLKKR